MAAAQTEDAILRSFPGPVTLYPARRKLLLLLFGCAVFDAIGIKMVADGASWGWPGLIFFGLGTVVAAVMLVPGAALLVLDRDGFQTTSLFRRRQTCWQDVSGFAPVSIPPSMLKLVAYDDVKVAGRTVARVNSVLAGRNTALSDTYGLSAAELARVMTQWRERALALQPRV
jgi:hypothetical protein